MMTSPRLTLADFHRSLADPLPPAGVSPALTALWWAGKDDWERAHEIVMAHDTTDCTWVHAYLHRLEGDLDNARYWYHRADRQPETGSLAAEWDSLAAALLAPKAAPR